MIIEFKTMTGDDMATITIMITKMMLMRTMMTKITAIISE